MWYTRRGSVNDFLNVINKKNDLTDGFSGVRYTRYKHASPAVRREEIVEAGSWPVSIGDKLSPISENFTLKDYTFKVLRDAILEMDIYGPDANLRLDERQMAERLGISRTPIREALARLAQEGLVEIVPRKGVFVLRKSREEVLEMVVTWAALESMAARLATEKASDADLIALRKFAMKHSSDAARADIAEYSDANIKFHQKILNLSGCSLLRTTADGLFTHMQAVRRRAMGESDRARRSVADHMEIIEALTARNADLASRLVREHTMRLHDHISKTWTRLESRGALRNAAV
jgi:DNA-binding GntR family transcriptional regulator